MTSNLTICSSASRWSPRIVDNDLKSSYSLTYRKVLSWSRSWALRAENWQRSNNPDHTAIAMLRLDNSAISAYNLFQLHTFLSRWSGRVSDQLLPERIGHRLETCLSWLRWMSPVSVWQNGALRWSHALSRAAGRRPLARKRVLRCMPVGVQSRNKVVPRSHRPCGDGIFLLLEIRDWRLEIGDWRRRRTSIKRVSRNSENGRSEVWSWEFSNILLNHDECILTWPILLLLLLQSPISNLQSLISNL